MTQQLTRYRDELLDRFLSMAWRQWTTAGVSSNEAPWGHSVIDPEALLVFSCTIGRYDARLFDAVQEWLGVNGRFLNIQRLKRILKEERFQGEHVVKAMAAASKTSVNQAKWAQITEDHRVLDQPEEPLFYRSSGEPLPIVRDRDPVFASYGFARDGYEERGVAEPFRPELPGNLLLRLRAFLGVSARCEVIAYLLVNGGGSPRAIASDCYYYPATISKAMSEMNGSGFLSSRRKGRRRLYSLTPDVWGELLFQTPVRPAWIVWPRLLSALEQVYHFLSDEALASKPSFEQASSLRRLLKDSVIPQLEGGLPGFIFGDLAAHPAEALIPFFVAQTNTALDKIM